MHTSLILYAEHEFNASTFTCRVIAGTGSDMYSAITGGIGALRGPKQTLSLKVGPDVNLNELNVGDRIAINYTQALALEMAPQPKKAKPAAKGEKKS